MHSQINIPSFSQSDASDENIVADTVPDSPLDSTQQYDDIIRGSAAGLAAKLSNLKKPVFSSSGDSGLHNEIKKLVAIELDVPFVQKDNVCLDTIPERYLTCFFILNAV